MSRDCLSEKDYYEIRLASLIDAGDQDVLLRLYQPLIGGVAVAIYLTLLNEKEHEEEGFVMAVSDLLQKLQISLSVLLTAKRNLEAVGLLKSFRKSSPAGSYLIFQLFAPKTPAAFFNDILFKGLLLQYVGEKKARRLAESYRLNSVIPAGYEEVTASFVDVYNPDWNDKSFNSPLGGDLLDHHPGRVLSVFDRYRFLEALGKASQIDTSLLLEAEIKELDRLATLFGLDEETMASIVASNFEPKASEHLDFQKIVEACKDALGFTRYAKKRGERSDIASDSELASKVRLMDQMAPAMFLRVLQNDTKPASKDLDIINRLSENYGFPSGVINVIVDYVLTKSNNILIYSYCEKIAASLAREKIMTTVDAMNYLNKIAVRRSRWNKPIRKLAEEEEKTVEPEEKVSDEEMEKILSDLASPSEKPAKHE